MRDTVAPDKNLSGNACGDEVSVAVDDVYLSVSQRTTNDDAL